MTTPPQADIERVARAMADAPWDVDSFLRTPNGEPPEEFREYWRDKARAALAAMQPAASGEERAALVERLRKVADRSIGFRREFDPDDRLMIRRGDVQAAIQAILQETDNGNA